MLKPDRICRHCAHYETYPESNAGFCLAQHGPNYFTLMLDTGTCDLWLFGSPVRELEVRR